MNTKPYDTASKYLTEQDPDALLRLLGCIAPDQEAQIEPLPKELSISTQVPDLVYRVVINQITIIVLIEMQTVYDYNMSMRMWEYGVRLWLLYKLPVYGYVLLLTKEKLPQGDLPPLLLDIGIADVKVKYELLKAWELDAQQALAMQRQSLLPFIALMRGDKEALTEAARRLKQVSDRQQREEMALHFFVLAGLRYNPSTVLEIMGGVEMISLEQLKESSTYQHILQEGKLEGRTEGLQEGRVEGERKILIKQIAKRFPNLDLQAEINSIENLSLLEDLCLKVIDAADAEEMKKSVLEAASNK